MQVIWILVVCINKILRNKNDKAEKYIFPLLPHILLKTVPSNKWYCYCHFINGSL